MVTRFLRSLVVASVAAPALAALAPIAAADGSVEVFPGMEIRQGTTVCTLGFVDPVARIGYSAGHCRGNGAVTDRDGRLIGVVAVARDNTPDGTVVRTDEVISDYETITLAKGVTVNTALPGGRQLVVDPGAPSGAGSAHLPLRRGQRGELRHRRTCQQRLVHHDQRCGEPEGRLGRARCTPLPATEPR